MPKKTLQYTAECFKISTKAHKMPYISPTLNQNHPLCAPRQSLHEKCSLRGKGGEEGGGNLTQILVHSSRYNNNFVGEKNSSHKCASFDFTALIVLRALDLELYNSFFFFTRGHYTIEQRFIFSRRLLTSMVTSARFISSTEITFTCIRSEWRIIRKLLYKGSTCYSIRW